MLISGLVFVVWVFSCLLSISLSVCLESVVPICGQVGNSSETLIAVSIGDSRQILVGVGS